MDAFFQPPARAEKPIRPPRYRRPAWFGAPSGALPGVLPLELVLARTERVAVCVTRLGAYAAGFELELVTMADEGDDEELDPMLFRGARLRHVDLRSGELPDQLLRFGVEFSDGSRATNTDEPMRGSEQPDGPLLLGSGGGGGGGNWRQIYWAWPLPPAGPLNFVLEWPALGIPLTRHAIEAQLILDAASRSQVLFSDAHLPEAPI